MKREQKKMWIFGAIRKKWLVLTPEEWVRQNVIQFLIQNKNYPQSSMRVEVPIELNHTQKRADLVVYKKHKPFFVVECKSSNLRLDEEVLNQILRYDLSLNASILMITNGINHYYFQLNHQKIKNLKSIPDYKKALHKP